jgi:tetratricopeptide (TPR) repeat protein
MIETRRRNTATRRLPTRVGLVLLAALAGTPSVGAQERAEPRPLVAAADSIALWEGLGDHHHAITTRDPRAQRYFDQGLRFVYAFDHPDAIRSFRLAQRIDPTCAMCFWGEALALGPNINVPMDSASGVAAIAALARARAAASTVSPRERAYIDALSARYSDGPAAGRKALDSAYARAMRRLHRSAPADDDAAVLYAESEMLLGPWDYWTSDRVAKPHAARAIAALEPVVRRSPRHAGACHFFIHAVEAAYPRRAVACAERLPALMPAAGHVVHMPAHIYARVGRYADAIARNEHALHADEPHLAEMPADGVYRLALHPHNAHFLAFAAAMIGRSAQAMEASRLARQKSDTSMLRTPGFGALQHYRTLPLLTMVRFGQWDAALAEAAPPEDLPYERAMRHFARSRALVARGDLAGAESELAALRRVRDDARVAGVTIWDLNAGATLLEIADASAAGEIAAARGDWGGAVAALGGGVQLEDGLTYDEPPTWHLPMREQLGSVLLRAGRARDAEAIFRADLDRHPENGWALAGLARSLAAQGRRAEAAAADRRFRRAWATADVPAPGS